MRDYEAVYIFDSALEESDVNEKLDRYHGLVTADGGEIDAVDHWGRRKLAYAINDRENGYYVVAHFSTVPERLPEFERIMQLDDSLLRYLIVINEGDLQTSIAPEEPGDEDEDSDDGED